MDIQVKTFSGRMTHLSGGSEAGVYLVIAEQEGQHVWRRWGERVIEEEIEEEVGGQGLQGLEGRR